MAAALIDFRSRDGMDNELTCFRTISPTHHLDPLPRFQILIVFEEVLDLLDRNSWHVADIVHMRITHCQLRHRDCDDLLVATTFVVHFEDTDRTNVDNCTRYDRTRICHQNIDSVTVVRKRVGYKPVIA